MPGYDVIISWHSLEHIPDGWLLGMPNPESFESSARGFIWTHPGTSVCFPLQTLVEICTRHDLRLLRITTSDTFSEIQSRHAWRTFARSLIPIRYVRGVLGITLGKLLYQMARRQQMTEGRGSSYTAVFVMAAGEHPRATA